MNFGGPPGKRTELAAICWYDNDRSLGGKKREVGVQTGFEPKLEESLSDFYPATQT